jgi:hypothetical protein
MSEKPSCVSALKLSRTPVIALRKVCALFLHSL